MRVTRPPKAPKMHRIWTIKPRSVPTVKRIATSDVVYLPGHLVSNVFAYFDRGKFVRKRAEFLALPERAGLRIVREEIVRCHPTNGRAMYLMMTLEPGGSAPPA